MFFTTDVTTNKAVFVLVKVIRKFVRNCMLYTIGVETAFLCTKYQSKLN